MWKALIKLVEKWAYRCEHDWELIDDVRVFKEPTSELPMVANKTYVCKKCIDSKTIKVRY